MSQAKNAVEKAAAAARRARAGSAEGCPRAAGRALVATLGLGAAFFDSAHDRCYCGACYPAEWPDLIETDGPRPYVIPRGWARFGLRLLPRAEALGREFFRTWCVGFHGAAAGVCKQILESGGMLLPGDRLLDGGVLRSGRCAGRQATKYYTSPSVRYAGLRFYAAPTPFVDAAGRNMLGQVSDGGRAQGRWAVWVIEWNGDGWGGAWGAAGRGGGGWWGSVWDRWCCSAGRSWTASPSRCSMVLLLLLPLPLSPPLPQLLLAPVEPLPLRPSLPRSTSSFFHFATQAEARAQA